MWHIANLKQKSGDLTLLFPPIDISVLSRQLEFASNQFKILKEEVERIKKTTEIELDNITNPKFITKSVIIHIIKCSKCGLEFIENDISKACAHYKETPK